MTDVDAPRRPRVLSGIQPTADSFHLGNYLGAVRQWVAMQDSYDAFYFIPDLHAITVEHDPRTLADRSRNAVAQLLALGLDAERCTLFVQSHVPEHAQLEWVLGCLTGFGEASRMTQFKDKSLRQGADRTTVGLFTYPVLQAADILLYQADRVPVGEDQRQHVELMREIARRFNERFGETLVEPELRVPGVGARIMDLQEPERKMSTTGGTPQGTVGLLDPPDAIRKKFRSAVTDSGREVQHSRDKPGISNLIEIMSVATGESIPTIEARYDGQGYGQFKADVGEAVVALIDPIRRRYEDLRSDPAELQRLLAVGAEKARRASEPTLHAMYERMGFVRSGPGRFFGAARPRGL